MPVRECSENGLPGYKWGSKGKCYTYKPGNERSRQAAVRKAQRQGRAIEASKRQRGQ